VGDVPSEPSAPIDPAVLTGPRGADRAARAESPSPIGSEPEAAVTEPSGRRLPLVLDVVGLLARLLLAGVWLASGVIKASNLAETEVAVQGYQLLPESLVVPVAAVLPYLEIAVGVLLALGLATRLAAILSLLLLAAFLVGVISAAARGLSIDCGCFGGGGQVATGATQYTWEILRDSGLVVVAGYLLARPWSLLSVDGWIRARAQARYAEPA
jgi:uncharacterized membrane protein YphA (DoxX/SURF4 family)